MRQRRLDQTVVRVDIHFEGTIPLAVFDILEALLAVLVRRVVHKDVELTELRDRPLDCVDADVGIGQIAFNDDAAAPCGFDGAACVLGVGAFVGQRVGWRVLTGVDAAR